MRGLVAALLLLAPLGLAQEPEPPGAPDEGRNPTRVVSFYGHVFGYGPGSPMPGNTQYPWGEEDFSRGFIQQGCVDEQCGGFESNLLYVYSTAGFVQVKGLDQWGGDYAQFHNERGQAKDILLDTTQDVTATAYLSSDAHRWALCSTNPFAGVPWPFPCWDWDPGFVPQVQVEATLLLAHLGEYQGQASEAPPVHEMLTSEGGTLVAQGVSEPRDILSLDANLNGGQGEVYELQVNLGKPQVDRIPRELDWVLRFRWWSSLAGHRAITPVPFDTNLNSGEFYPNRFTLPVKNPFDVELVFPQFLHDKLLIHAMLNSPWGSYDVDAKSVRLVVVGDGNVPVEPLHVARSADFSVAHGGHYKPVNITWVWDYKADGLKPGTYEATVTAWNFQHSAESSTTASFRVSPDGSGETLSVGRSGQATFTEGQLRGAQEGAAGGG